MGQSIAQKGVMQTRRKRKPHRLLVLRPKEKTGELHRQVTSGKRNIIMQKKVNNNKNKEGKEHATDCFRDMTTLDLSPINDYRFCPHEIKPAGRKNRERRH